MSGPEGSVGISFVDLAGFTALTEAHGDEEAADLAARFVAIARAEAAEGDQVVKSIGDAVLLRSATAPAALRFAAAVMARCGAEPDFPIPRGGVHAGPVAERDGDVFGATVNTAARIAAQAHGGQLLISDTVRSSLPADDHDGLVDLGQFRLRNVADPVHLFQYRVGVDEGEAGIDPVCRMRVARDRAAGRLRHEGTDYWFCSLRCAATFAADPDRVVGGDRD